MNPPPERSDAELAQLAAGGDERAFAELVERHKDSLYRLLRRYVGDPDEAYEAAHEAFIAAWSALKRYDPSRPFGAWLRTIAINKARDRGRRLAVRRFVFGTPSGAESSTAEIPDRTPNAEDDLVERARLAELDRAISQLPTNLKEALILTAIDGRSQQQAGEILGVSAKTIETRVYRARRALARTLDPAIRTSP
ncbi:RNA polymerase sigma factor [Phenylobacterium sp.]|uniref:RNA polymerase sigma factor n=1 Tax=Phenylobacterium sp. TaxID=1871053 RepID=UPI00356933F5